MKRTRMQLVIISMFLLNGCGMFNDNRPYVKFTNYTNKDIGLFCYPDTTTWFPDSAMNMRKIASPIEACSYNHFRLSDQRKPSIYVYVLDLDTVQKYGWNRVKDERRYIQRYTLYKANRDYKRDYSYPPSPDMRTIQMYPEYGVNEAHRTCKSINPYRTVPEESEE